MRTATLLSTSITLLLITCSCESGSSERVEKSDRKPAESKRYPSIGGIERHDPALDALIAPDAKIDRLADGFEWSEGPVWVRNGNYLLFSDVPKNVVHKWEERSGSVSDHLRPSGYTGSTPRGGEPGSNGLTLDSMGRLVLCQHGD